MEYDRTRRRIKHEAEASKAVETKLRTVDDINRHRTRVASANIQLKVDANASTRSLSPNISLKLVSHLYDQTPNLQCSLTDDANTLNSTNRPTFKPCSYVQNGSLQAWVHSAFQKRAWAREIMTLKFACRFYTESWAEISEKQSRIEKARISREHSIRTLRSK